LPACALTECSQSRQWTLGCSLGCSLVSLFCCQFLINVPVSSSIAGRARSASLRTRFVFAALADGPTAAEARLRLLLHCTARQLSRAAMPSVPSSDAVALLVSILLPVVFSFFVFFVLSPVSAHSLSLSLSL